MTMLPRAVLVLSLAATLVGCGQGKTSQNCGARTQAVTSTSLASQLPSWVSQRYPFTSSFELGHWGALPGGILEIAPPGVEGKLRCTVSLEPVEESGRLRLYAWTAEHCLSPSLAGGLTLHAWSPSEGVYRSLSAKRLLHESFRPFEAGLSALPADKKSVADEALWRGAQTARERAVAVCADATKAAGRNLDSTFVTCSSNLDLARFELEILGAMPSSLEAFFREEGRRLASDWTAARAKFASLPFVPAADVELMSRWSELVQELTDIRMARSFAAVGEKVPELASVSRSVGPGDTKLAPEVRLQKVEDNIAYVVGRLRFIVGIEEKLLLQFNFRNDTKRAIESGLAPQESLGFGAVPLSYLAASGVQKQFVPVVVDGRELGVVVSVARSGAAIRLERGDSGGTVSLLGIMPLYVLTTVDGDATSGGIPLRRLPSRGAEAPASSNGPQAGGEGNSSRGKQASVDSPCSA